MKIIINGKRHDITGAPLSYEDIVELAGYSRDRILSVTYRWTGPGDWSRQGMPTPGEQVVPSEGMAFNVART